MTRNIYIKFNGFKPKYKNAKITEVIGFSMYEKLETIEYIIRLGNTNHKEIEMWEDNEKMVEPDLGTGTDQ
jgi:hypothetical protein